MTTTTFPTARASHPGRATGGGSSTPGLNRPSGSSACLIAGMAAISAGERVRCSQPILARPTPCSALMLPPISATRRSTASSTASSSSAGGPTTLTWRLPSPDMAPQDHVADGATAATSALDGGLEVGQPAEGQGDVKLVRNTERVDRLGVPLPKGPQLLAGPAAVGGHRGAVVGDPGGGAGTSSRRQRLDRIVVVRRTRPAGRHPSDQAMGRPSPA